MREREKKSSKPAKSTVKTPFGPELSFKKKNYILLGIGVLTIAAGFISLNAGSITLAPFLLIVGYCILIPLALLLK